MRMTVSKRLASYDLTLNEWLLLEAITMAPSTGLSITAAASALDMSMPQTTLLAGKLVKSRLARQKTQSYDKRSRHVIVTAKGKHISTKVRGQLMGLLEELDTVLGEGKVHEYSELAERVAHVLSEENTLS
jgi:DNA-binding MarR family transcriptional regulator